MKLKIWYSVEDDYPFRKGCDAIVDFLIIGNQLENLDWYINELIIYKR